MFSDMRTSAFVSTVGSYGGRLIEHATNTASPSRSSYHSGPKFIVSAISLLYGVDCGRNKVKISSTDRGELVLRISVLQAIIDCDLI